MSLPDEEPTVRLSSGRDVLRCVVESIRQLQDSGHAIRVVDGAVIVSPPINEDWTEVLSAQHQDVADILAESHRP